MADTPSPEGQSTPEATPEQSFDLNSVLARKEVQEYLLGVVRKATAEADGRYKPQVDALKREMGQKENAWGEEKRKLRATAEASALEGDAVKLRDRLIETDTREAQAAARISEAEARAKQVEVREALLELREQFPKLPKTFWDDARERLTKGEVYSSTIAIEAMALAGAAGTPESQPKPDMAPATAGLTRGGAAGKPLDAYRQALRDGKPLPSAAEIDRITAGFAKE